MTDELGNRIKAYYERPASLLLPRSTYAVVRIDGRGFHTFTADLPRPYHRPLADAMDQAALSLCLEMHGAVFAFGQSDEYSFLFTDLGPQQTPLWFDGSVQKIASVSASIFTARFNRVFVGDGLATFDARVFAIPQREEAIEYFHWRQQDATRNSLNMLASVHYSHAELLNRTTSEKHELLHARGENWAKWPAAFKRGRAVRRAPEWAIDLEVPIFQREPHYLEAIVPSASIRR